MSVLSVLDGGGFYDNIAAAASDCLHLSGSAEMELLFVSPEEMQAINLSERGIDAVTDVLSFPTLALTAGEYAPFMPENFPADTDPESGSVMLGSIVICEMRAAEQAEEYDHGIERELGYLFLHGLLHLLGYDHMREDDKAVMRAAEEEILARAGLPKET